jgi:hypothetical protein
MLKVKACTLRTATAVCGQMSCEVFGDTLFEPWIDKDIFCFVLFFNIYGSVQRKNILIYIQQDAMLHSLFYLETTLHVSGVGTTRNM